MAKPGNAIFDRLIYSVEKILYVRVRPFSNIYGLNAVLVELDELS